MIATKRTIETEEDRYGGFNTQQSDLFSSKTYESPYVSRSFSFGENETTTENQTDDFEVEKEYNFEDYTSSLNTAQARPVKSFMPRIERERPQVQVVDEVEVTQTKTKLRLNARGKILVGAYSLVVAILVAFAIYNAIAIANLNTAVATKTAEYTTMQSQVTSLESEYQTLGAQDTVGQKAAVEQGFKEATSEDYVSISLGEKQELVNIEESTNLFDKICNFLSNLF